MSTKEIGKDLALQIRIPYRMHQHNRDYAYSVPLRRLTISVYA